MLEGMHCDIEECLHHAFRRKNSVLNSQSPKVMEIEEEWGRLQHQCEAVVTCEITNLEGFQDRHFSLRGWVEGGSSMNSEAYKPDLEQDASQKARRSRIGP